jgi:Fe-S cluster assembly protein SufD
MNTIEFYKEQFDRLQSASEGSQLKRIRQEAFNSFNKAGIPGSRHEEWKYTRISGLLIKNMNRFSCCHIACN